jgi:hypothetical protein
MAIRAIEKSGAVSCERFLAGEITKISPGYGLIGGGASGEGKEVVLTCLISLVKFEIDKQVIQHRVTSICPPDTAISGLSLQASITNRVQQSIKMEQSAVQHPLLVAASKELLQERGSKVEDILVKSTSLSILP